MTAFRPAIRVEIERFGILASTSTGPAWGVQSRISSEHVILANGTSARGLDRDFYSLFPYPRHRGSQ